LGGGEEGTDHVALAVLSGLLLGDVGLQAHEYDHGVFDGVEVGPEAADEEEALAVVDLAAQAVESVLESWKREGLSIRELAVEFVA